MVTLAAAPPPAVSSGGVVNGASFVGGAAGLRLALDAARG